MRALLILLCAAGIVWADNNECLRCHGSRQELLKALDGKDRPIPPLLVDWRQLERSVHAAEGCTDCHVDGFEEYPHADERESATCADCHEDAAEIYAKSMHGKSEAEKTSCADCHGVHNVFKPTARASTLHPLNVHKTCGKCHTDPKYVVDAHGHGLAKSGLVVAANCVSCHGGHEIRPQGDPDSPLAKSRVANTCGKCHEGALEDYHTSVHFVGLRSGNPDAATCTDCHPPHAHKGESAVATCGRCHEERVGSFQASHHGKVSALGFRDGVADCASCHGAHGIVESTNPRSRVHADNLVETCGACHKDSHAEFVRFRVHADADDAARYPGLYWLQRVMVWLVIGVFAAGGLHGVLWLVRSLLEKEWRRPHPANGRYIRRWRQFYVVLHVTFMTSFLILAATGLPLHYATEPWAGRLMRALGGAQIAGWLHRLSAIVMLGCVASYLANIFYRFLVKHEGGLFWGPNSMVPRWKDVQDFLGNVRWFLRGGPKPRFDRWTYWEKFDFWAVFWGIVIIGGSGVILWFPALTTQVLPGWIINVAVIIHGHEALLAVGFIFTIHIFHANLRPDKFPMDTLFYTGRIPEAEFKEERPVEYERALADGTYEAMLDDAPRDRTRRRAHIVGTLALIAGISLTALMVLAAIG